MEEAKPSGTTIVERKVKDEKTGKVITKKEEVQTYEYKLPKNHVPEAEDWGIAEYKYPDLKIDIKTIFDIGKEEKISGIKLNQDGSYIKDEQKDSDEILKGFFHYNQIVDMLYKTQLEVKDDNSKGYTGLKEGIVSAAVKVHSGFDRLGKTIKQGSRCRICRRHVDYLPADGYCSVECFTKDLAHRLLTQRIWS